MPAAIQQPSTLPGDYTAVDHQRLVCGNSCPCMLFPRRDSIAAVLSRSESRTHNEVCKTLVVAAQVAYQ